MKTSKAYYYQGKFKYLEGDGWPVMDLKSFYAAHYVIAKMEYEVTKLEYQEALTSALSRAIDFEDQVNIEGIVREELGPDPWNRPLQEGLYNIPEIEIKVVNRWIGHNEDSACTEPVARIKDSTEFVKINPDLSNRKESLDSLRKMDEESSKSEENDIWIKRDREWNDYPLRTKASAIMGGHWIKNERGWKWCTGSTFPTPGGDASGFISLPADDINSHKAEKAKEYASTIGNNNGTAMFDFIRGWEACQASGSKSEEETEDVHNEAFDILQKYTGEEYWCDEVLEAMERYALQFKSHDDQSAWRDVYISFNKRDGLIAFAERMSQRFTITRKS